jgi:hypothetical protein
VLCFFTTKDLADWINKQAKKKKYRNKSRIKEIALAEFKELAFCSKT